MHERQREASHPTQVEWANQFIGCIAESGRLHSYMTQKLTSYVLFVFKMVASGNFCSVARQIEKVILEI